MTTHRRSIAFAVEPAFGALGAGSPVPDPTALTYQAILCDRASITPTGEPKVATREVARTGPYARPAKPVTLYDGDGHPIPRASGQVQITLRALLLGLATGEITDYDNHPIAVFLGSTLCDAGNPASASVTVTGAGGVNTFVVATGGMTRGELFRTIINGLAEYSAVTKIVADTSDTVSHSPACSRALTTSDVLRKLRTFYVANGAQSPGNSLSFQLDGHGWRERAFGCRWSELSITMDGDEAVFAFTFEAPYIRHYNDEAEVIAGTNVLAEVVPDGPATSLLGGHQVLSSTDAGAVTAGATLGRLAVDVEAFSLSIKATLSPKGVSTSILGMSDQVVADITAELSLTLSEVVDALKDDLWREISRSALVGFGGRTNGTGMVVYFPCAVVKTDPNVRNTDGDIIKQVLTYEIGLWKGDENAGAGLAGSLFRIGLVL